MATALDRVHAEVNRPAVILALFLLLAGIGALSQNGLPSPGLPQNLRSTTFRPAQEQRPELRSVQSSLPDAPSAVPAKQRERFQAFTETITPLVFDGAAITATMARESPEYLAPGATPSYSALYGAPVVQKESNVSFDKYLNSSLLREGMRYHPSTSDSFLGRASYAASRLFITRDDSGKRKFNASYLLAALASAAASSTTYRLYRTQHVPGTFGNIGPTQHVSNTFGNFGSTVGSDAGRNILQQFWPRIHQTLGGHTLKALQRNEGRIAMDPTPAVLVSTPAR